MKLIVLAILLKLMARKRLLSYRLAKWIAVVFFALSVIPISNCVGLAFATGLVWLICLIVYCIFWLTEQYARRNSRDNADDGVIE